MALGFGAGGAELKTVVKGFLMTAQGLRALGSGEVEAGSGKMPGGAVPLVVTVATANPLGLVVAGAAKAYGEASGSETIEGAAHRGTGGRADALLHARARDRQGVADHRATARVHQPRAGIGATRARRQASLTQRESIRGR